MPEPSTLDAIDAKYSERASRSRSSSRVPGRRLRTLYFALAALWGYILGFACLAGALALTGALPDLSAAALGLGAVGGVAAMAGGTLAAAAYREARRRSR